MPQASGRPGHDARAIMLDDATRAAMYRLLARFMDAPPGTDELAAAAALRADGSPLEAVIATFAAAAARTSPGQQSVDFHDLFIGLAAGEIVPYASHYDTGTLNDLALLAVRRDLQHLGLRRRPGIAEPEDHAAAVLEAMADLIEKSAEPGDRGGDADAFLERHVLSWMPRLFQDLAGRHERPVYSALGALGAAFLDGERVHLSERETEAECAT